MSISQSASHPQLLHLNPNIQSTLAHGLVFHLTTYLGIIPHWHPELGLSFWTVRMDALQDGASFMGRNSWNQPFGGSFDGSHGASGRDRPRQAGRHCTRSALCSHRWRQVWAVSSPSPSRAGLS